MPDKSPRGWRAVRLIEPQDCSQPHWLVRACDDPSIAFGAIEHIAKFLHRVSLEIGLVAVLVAVRAKPMGWLGSAGVWFQHVRNTPATDAVQRVAPLFAVPCSSASHFLFKLSYAIDVRQMRLIGCHNALLNINQSCLKIGNL